jgi:hypothetical protein
MGNAWIELRTRAIEIPAAAPDALPERPEQALEPLVRWLLEHAVPARAEYEREPREHHARPFADCPHLVHGRTFFDLRPAIARALLSRDDYRRRLAARPAHEREPTASLAAWHGDISAHDLLARWEAGQIDRRLGGERSIESALAQWRALRGLFFVPSYARVLALLAPVRDPASGRIGFWRIVLPRPGWIVPRIRGHEERPDYAGLPVDLIPDLPLGLWVVDALAERHPLLVDRLREGDWRAEPPVYELLGRSGRHDPRRAFEHTRVTVRLRSREGEGEGEGEALRVCADVEVDRKRDPPGVALVSSGVQLGP